MMHICHSTVLRSKDHFVESAPSFHIYVGGSGQPCVALRDVPSHQTLCYYLVPFFHVSNLLFNILSEEFLCPLFFDFFFLISCSALILSTPVSYSAFFSFPCPCFFLLFLPPVCYTSSIYPFPQLP